jgi:aldehyde:ferredoxin oxidoreductase
MRRAQDTIPDKMKMPSLVGHRASLPVYTDEMFQAGLTKYYEARGYTQDGLVTPEQFKKVGLEDYVKYLPV